jgi:hypothetical protein
MEKNYMFQYAHREQVLEDTDLITKQEAEDLWDKWITHLKDNWDSFSRPQMCIWKNCIKNTDYSEIEKEIDYRDCELEKGRFYKVTKVEIR